MTQTITDQNWNETIGQYDHYDLQFSAFDGRPVSSDTAERALNFDGLSFDSPVSLDHCGTGFPFNIYVRFDVEDPQDKKLIRDDATMSNATKGLFYAPPHPQYPYREWGVAIAADDQSWEARYHDGVRDDHQLPYCNLGEWNKMWVNVFADHPVDRRSVDCYWSC